MKGSIGIFDSGVGGLTVMKEIIKILPKEDIIYFGDTARVPYGNKSKETVRRYSLQIIKFLLKYNPKIIVVACNTVSAVALDYLKGIVKKIPILGVIKPGAISAVEKTKNKKIGVIGTTTTIESKIYEKIIHKLDKSIKVLSFPCPLFVPLVEEGLNNKKIINLIVEYYLRILKRAKIDTLILGCTHYPALKRFIQNFFGNNVCIINSGTEVAKEVKKLLLKPTISSAVGHGKSQLMGGNGNHYFYVTDSPELFFKIGRKFLNIKKNQIKKVNLNSNIYTDDHRLNV